MLRKSPLKPSTKPLARAPFRSRPKEPGAVRKTLKARKVPPTAEELRWMDAIAGLGCAVCLKFHRVNTPAAVHHIVEGSRRLGHFYTIPLCDPGHHQNTPTSQKISRHPTKARFEKTYGSEYELLEYVQNLLNWKPV